MKCSSPSRRALLEMCRLLDAAERYAPKANVPLDRNHIPCKSRSSWRLFIVKQIVITERALTANWMVEEMRFPRWLSGRSKWRGVSCVRLAPALRGLFGIGVTAIVVLAAGGCGGGSSSSAASLKSYLIQGNEETGYAIQRPLEHYKTAARYATSEQNPADAQRLTRAGFQQALVENTGGGNGLSFVLQFATASDAAREQSYEFQTDFASQGGLPFRFSVSGVPGADGFGLRPVAGQGDANALFREGRCLLLVGDESAPHPKSYEAAVVAGVQAIYARTAGHDGVCSG